MDIRRYAELKASGNLTLQKIEGSVFAVKKNYDPDSGKLKDSTILPVDIASFLKHKADAQEMVNAVILFLNDVETLENE